MHEKVMIVDDNPFIVDLMAEKLREIGVDVVCVLDGVEALNRLQWDDYALFIADLELQGLSGLRVIEYARQRYPELPIIALVIDDDRSQAEAQQLGATVLSKPFSMVEFREVVENVLHDVRAGPQRSSSSRRQVSVRDQAVGNRKV
jgi:two-component system alkaline phosphatase synthesis response regulator PhoP